MRVVHLTPELPYWPGGSGGATRQFHLLRRLVELGHEVAVVAPATAEQRRRIDSGGLRVNVSERPPSRVREAVTAVAHDPALLPAVLTRPVLAWQVGVFWASLRQRALEALTEVPPDVVTIEHDNAAAWVADLPAGIPAALILQNVGWSYYESRARAAHGAARAALFLEARRFRRHHARWLHRYRRIIAVSERDRADLATVTDTPVDLVPNGVACDEFLPEGKPEPATLLFTGTLAHPPNAEGIRWFAGDVWPRLRAARDDARLLVVGRDPPSSVLALARAPGIEVVGPVPEMGPYFSRATAVVAPLRSGGGTRLKILEALAAGRAVVSTTVGCEGLELSDGQELLIADGAEGFASATLRLLEDGSLRERLATQGRAKVERLYDWRVLGDRLASVLEEMR